MARMKAVFRGQAISCAGKKLYGQKHRGEYLAQLGACALRRRAELLYQELEAVQQLRRQAKREMIVECRKYPETKLLRSVPFLGPVRAAVLIGRVQTPHRFRTKRQFWAYCGLALETRDSGEYRVVDGQVERRKKPAQIRGLNWNHNHELKNLFKAAANFGQPSAPGSVSRVLSWAAEEKHAAGDGAADAGAQDRRHRAEDLEERRSVRRGTCEATSSLSAWCLARRCGLSYRESSNGN